MYYIAKMNEKVIAYGRNPEPGSGIDGAVDELFEDFESYAEKLSEYGIPNVEPIEFTEEENA
jgi:hypothetical protein